MVVNVIANEVLDDTVAYRVMNIVFEEFPDAMQIADRFHLHQNFLECIRKVLQQHIPEKIRADDKEIIQNAQEKTAQTIKNDKIQNRIKLIREIQQYYAQGVSKRKLASMYHISRNTISRYLEGDPEKLACTQRKDRINFDSLTDEIVELLKTHTVKKAYLEAVKLGYNGKQSQFYEKSKKLFIEYSLPRIKKNSDGKNTADVKITHHYVKRTDIFQQIWNEKGNITKHDLKQIENAYPAIMKLNNLVLEFRKIFSDKSIVRLCQFLIQNKDSSYGPVRSFVKNIIKDIRPVANAVCTEYSNGFVEGTNNKLKMIKRQGYGRCSIKLLRAKIILQSF